MRSIFINSNDMPSQLTHYILDKTPRAVLLVLIVFTPLAFGTVHVWAYTLMEMMVLVMVTLALLKIIWDKKGVRWVQHPVNIILGIFGVYLCVQMIPLSEELIKGISPGAFKIHQKYLAWLPGGTEKHQFAISLNVHKTKVELFKILAYFGVFLFVINMVRQRRQINYILAAIILVGFFEAGYAINQKFSEIDSVEWVQRESWIGGAVSGTYINRNNFSGYLEMVIVLLFGQVVYFFSSRKKSREGSRKSERKFSFANIWRDEAKYSKRFLSLSALFLMGAAVILSQSRGGILAIAVGMAVVLVFSYAQIKFKRLAFFFAH